MSVIHISDSTFQTDVAQSDKPVLVDFWAEWCAPCKAIAPILDELADDFQDRLQIAKIDVEANPQITQQFSVRNIPTLILFKNGVVEAQQVGGVSKKQLKDFLEANL
jgi:thioredoxin 1